MNIGGFNTEEMAPDYDNPILAVEKYDIRTLAHLLNRK